MNVRVYIPKIAADVAEQNGFEWTDRELVFLSFMFNIATEEGWGTRYYMHTQDFCRITGYHINGVHNKKNDRLRHVFQLGALDKWTMRIEGKPTREWGGNIVRSRGHQLTDVKAIAMYYYLCGVMVKGFDHMLSDHKDGTEIVYTYRDQGRYPNSKSFDLQLEAFNDEPERIQ